MSAAEQTLDEELDALVAPVEAPPHVIAQRAHHEGKSGWKVQVTSDDAEVSTEATTDQLPAAGDWSGVLRHFGLDPEEFEIVDDTVRIGSWQQSKGLDNGERDTITLYSYRARFRRITERLPQADMDELRKVVQRWKPLTRKSPGAGLGAPCTFYVGWADWQLGKDGTKAYTIQRVLDSFEQAQQRVKELRKIGRNVQGLAIANMGDPTEGCYGNYASQLFTIEMNRRKQMNLALDLWLTGLRTLAPLFDDVHFISVLCNHGELERGGEKGRQQTSDSDNLGGFLPETVRRVLENRPGFDHVQWTIPQSEMNVYAELSGVPVAFTHGHKAPSAAKLDEWMSRHSIGMLRQHGREPRLWMTAHRHHYDIVDTGAYWRIQHPALDSGSKWHFDISGRWSAPLTFTCLVGEHEQAGGPLAGKGRGFSDEFVLIPAA